MFPALAQAAFTVNAAYVGSFGNDLYISVAESVTLQLSRSNRVPSKCWEQIAVAKLLLKASIRRLIIGGCVSNNTGSPYSLRKGRSL